MKLISVINTYKLSQNGYVYHSQAFHRPCPLKIQFHGSALFLLAVSVVANSRGKKTVATQSGGEVILELHPQQVRGFGSDQLARPGLKL